MELSRQQKIIVEALRSLDWVCQTAWLGQIKDDRRRITDLNRGYMREKGYRIVGKPCDGRCQRTHSSGLFMRRAEKLTTPHILEGRDLMRENEKKLEFFDRYPLNVI